MAIAAALTNIKGFLMLRFGESRATRARVVEVEASLQGLARIHSRVQPPDYRMTYPVAEAIFSVRISAHRGRRFRLMVDGISA